MGRVSDDEREALRLAAVAAVPILARLEREYAELGKRIAVHKATIAMYEAASGKRPKPAAEPGATPENGSKTPRGRVVEHIDAILGPGTALTEPELRSQIKDRLNATYSRASVYSALQRGVRSGKYEMRADKTWCRKKVTEGIKIMVAN